jgi:tungstate transport system substrate-binding protein
MQAKLPLKELASGDPRLFNPYGVIAVNPDRYRDINYRGAMRLIAWLTSVEGQKIIEDFRIDGQPLFVPTAVHPAGP